MYIYTFIVYENKEKKTTKYSDYVNFFHDFINTILKKISKIKDFVFFFDLNHEFNQ